MLAFERRAVIAYRVEDNRLRVVSIFYRGLDCEALLRGGLAEED